MNKELWIAIASIGTLIIAVATIIITLLVWLRTDIQNLATRLDQTEIRLENRIEQMKSRLENLIEQTKIRLEDQIVEVKEDVDIMRAITTGKLADHEMNDKPEPPVQFDPSAK